VRVAPLTGRGDGVSYAYLIFINVVEAPNNETIARISLELGARGTIQIMTLPAIPVEELQARLRK